MKTTWSKLWKSIGKHSSKAMLFYGNDANQLPGRVRDFVRCAYAGYKIHELTSQDVIKDPECLTKISAMDDLFITDRQDVIIISQATDALLKVISAKWEKEFDIPLLIWSAKLTKKSKMRAYFERTQNLEILPSYDPDSEGFKAQLQYFSGQQGLEIMPSIEGAIGEQLSWNALFLETYIEKIKWLIKDEKRVAIEHVWACGITPDPEIERFIHSFLSRDRKLVVASLGFWEKEGSIQNLYFMSFYFWKILELKEIISKGIAPAQAVYKLRPILPPHISAILIQGAVKWSEKEIQTLLGRFLKTERAIKLNEEETTHLARDFLAMVG